MNKYHGGGGLCAERDDDARCAAFVLFCNQPVLPLKEGRIIALFLHPAPCGMPLLPLTELAVLVLD